MVFANDVTGEGMDRPSLALPGDQDQLIAAVAKANPRTVVVLHTASAVLMPWRNKVAGIVEAWYPGQQSGAAIAKTLFGDVDPSGRLPVTFPRLRRARGRRPTTPRAIPGIGNVVQYSEGLFVGYRFFDRYRQQPLFPFGYGLSYTHFKLSGLKVTKRGGGRYGVSVRVRNTGRRAGAEVVQLYVGFPPKTGEPPRQLKAFGKVFLGAGRGPCRPAQPRPLELPGLRRGGQRLEDQAGHLPHLRRHARHATCRSGRRFTSEPGRGRSAGLRRHLTRRWGALERLHRCRLRRPAARL